MCHTPKLFIFKLYTAPLGVKWEREIYINNIKTVIILLVLYLGIGQITSLYANISQEYKPKLLPPSYSSVSVLVMEASTGMVLYAANAAEIKYPAGIIKIMTALIVLLPLTLQTLSITISKK